MTANELWGNTEIICEHTFLITLKIAVLSDLSFAQNTFFNKGYFYSRSFQKYSRTSGENSRTIQGYPTNFQFSRTFQGHDDFSRTFQGPCKPCK